MVIKKYILQELTKDGWRDIIESEDYETLIDLKYDLKLMFPEIKARIIRREVINDK